MSINFSFGTLKNGYSLAVPFIVCLHIFYFRKNESFRSKVVPSNDRPKNVCMYIAWIKCRNNVFKLAFGLKCVQDWVGLSKIVIWSVLGAKKSVSFFSVFLIIRKCNVTFRNNVFIFFHKFMLHRTKRI
jgi:hypothetical protein